MLVLYALITVIFWPDLVSAAAWFRGIRSRRDIRRQAREACELVDIEYELLMHSER